MLYMYMAQDLSQPDILNQNTIIVYNDIFLHIQWSFI